MSALPANQLGQMSANAAAIERAGIYRREALWSMTTGEQIMQARQQRMDSWSDDGIFKTVGKAMLESTGLYDAGPRSGQGAFIQAASDIFDFNLLDQSERFGAQAIGAYSGGTIPMPRDSTGRIQQDPDATSRAITSGIADSLFYGAIHDQNYTVDDNTLARYGYDNDGTPFSQETLLEMAKAGSEYEIAHLRASALKQRDQERRMGRFSTPAQFAYGIVGSLGDPTAFASGAIAGMGAGAIGGAVLRTTGGTLARMGEAGFIARTSARLVARAPATAKEAAQAINGLVPAAGFRATLAAGENVAQGYAVNAAVGDDYSWRQAAIDASIGVGFSTAGSVFGKVIRANERMTIADTGAEATPASEFYFSEVPGHRPTATAADLARADASRAMMSVVGDEPAIPQAAAIRGRTMLTEDGRRGRVVDVVGDQVMLSIDGKPEAHGIETLGIDRTRVPFVGDKVRTEDGLVGKIDRIENDYAIIKSLSDATEHRVPTWLLDQESGPATVRKGVTAFDPQGRAVIAFLQGRDISTVAHESGHLFRKTLRAINSDAADTLNGLFGEGSDKWSVHSEEKFARAFETYLAEGKAPTPGLRGVFEQFKTWLTDLWQSLVQDSPEQITPELRAIMGKMLGEGQEGGTGAFDRAGENYKRVRGEIIATLGKDGKHSAESSAMLALIHANAGAWARGSGKGFDAYFTDVLVGVQKNNIGPDRFMRQMLPANRAALIPSDIRYDYIKQRWARAIGEKAAKSQRISKAKASAEQAGIQALEKARIDKLAALTASDVDKNRWITAANRLQVEDPNVVTRPLDKAEYDAIIGELSLKRLSTVNGIVTVVQGMNGHARLVDGRLEISPALAALPAEQRLTMVRNAILARDIVMILGEEAWKGNPVPPPSPKALAAWMDRKGLLPHEEAGPVAIAAVNTMERMHNPVVAADTLIGGTKDLPPETGGATADLPGNPDTGSGGDAVSTFADIETRKGPISVIENRIKDAATELGLDTTIGNTDNYEILGATAFRGKLPSWANDAIAQNPELRTVFTIAKDGEKSGALDMVVELGGEEKYLEWVRSSLRTTARRAIEVTEGASPELDFLAALHKELVRTKSGRSKVQYLNAHTLPEGSEFVIAGRKASIESVATDKWGGPYLSIVADGLPVTPIDSVFSPIPIEPDSLTVLGPRVMKKRSKWLAKKAAQEAEINNASEYAAFLERERAEREAIEGEINDFIRQERESPHADQDPMYDSAFDPAFATMYEQTGPVVGGKPTTAQGYRPDPSDPKVFDFSRVVGGKIKGWIGKVDIIGRADHLSDSTSKFVQDASAILFDTALVNENGVRNATPAEIGVKQKVNAIFGGYLTKSGTAFDGYAAANKVPLLERSEARVAFEREVGRLSSMPGKPSDPHLAAAVDAARSAIKEAHAIALANGVNLPDFDPAYFMRLWSAGRKATLLAKMDALGIQNAASHIDTLLREAVLKKRADLTPAEAQALGETYSRRIDEVSTKSALDRMRVMSNLENFDRTFNMLVADGMEATDARVLATKLAGSPTTGNQPNPTQGRGWALDDRHSITVQGPQGPFTFSVADLMETDAGTIVSHYSRAMVSEAAMTSTLRELSTRYGKSISSIESLLAEADKELSREVGMTSGKRQRQIKRLSTGISLIKGLPTHETTGLTQTMQALQKVNYIRMQGGFVVSAAFELATIASRASFGAMLKTVPLAREIYSQMKAGKVDGQVARAILSSMGAGYEGQIRAYLPDLGERDATTGAGGRFLNAANRKLGKGQTAVSRATFFEQLNTFSQVWARTTYLQHLTDMARRDQSPSAKRLAQIGMDQATWDAIRADLKKNAAPSQGAGGIVFDINLDGMDPMNRTRLLQSVDAKARELIQEPTIGGSDYWLETPGARMVNQYRGFALASWQKQLLTNLQTFDGESAAFFTAAMGLGTLQYTLLSYLDSRGADDPEADFEKRTTLARLGYGGFSRAAFSGIAPTLIDTALFPLGIKPLQGGRTTGQNGYSIFNFPTQQLVNDAVPAAIGLARSAIDPSYDLSEQDVRGARSLVPLSRFPGVTSITNGFLRDSDLPKKPQKLQTDILKMLDGDQ